MVAGTAVGTLECKYNLRAQRQTSRDRARASAPCTVEAQRTCRLCAQEHLQDPDIRDGSAGRPENAHGWARHLCAPSATIRTPARAAAPPRLAPTRPGPGRTRARTRPLPPPPQEPDFRDGWAGRPENAHGWARHLCAPSATIQPRARAAAPPRLAPTRPGPGRRTEKKQSLNIHPSVRHQNNVAKTENRHDWRRHLCAPRATTPARTLAVPGRGGLMDPTATASADADALCCANGEASTPTAAAVTGISCVPAAPTQALRGHAGGKPPGPPPRSARTSPGTTPGPAHALDLHHSYAALAPPASATAAGHRDALSATSQTVRRAHDHRQAPHSNGAASPHCPHQSAGRAARGPRRPSWPPSALGHKTPCGRSSSSPTARAAPSPLPDQPARAHLANACAS